MPQLVFTFATARGAPAAAPPTPEEKATVRLRQGGKCARCGGQSKGGIGLDVVRDQGVLVGYCRRHRLQWDALWRCRKGAWKRRRAGRKARKPTLERALPLPAGLPFVP